jgi:hypothetical protein
MINSRGSVEAGQKGELRMGKKMVKETDHTGYKDCCCTSQLSAISGTCALKGEPCQGRARGLPKFWRACRAAFGGGVEVTA